MYPYPAHLCHWTLSIPNLQYNKSPIIRKMFFILPSLRPSCFLYFSKVNICKIVHRCLCQVSISLPVNFRYSQSVPTPKMPSTFLHSLRISFLSPKYADKLKTFDSIALMVLLKYRCWGTWSYINSFEWFSISW